MLQKIDEEFLFAPLTAKDLGLNEELLSETLNTKSVLFSLASTGFFSR